MHPLLRFSSLRSAHCFPSSSVSFVRSSVHRCISTSSSAARRSLKYLTPTFLASDAGPLEARRCSQLNLHPQGPQHLAHQLKQPFAAHRNASATGLFIATVVALLGLSAYYKLHPHTPASAAEDLAATLNEMATEIAPGRPGNLTPEQEEKLRKLWQYIFQVCAVGQEQSSSAENAPAAEAEKSQDADKKEKKSRMSLFSRKSKKDSDGASSSGDSSAPPGARVVLHLKDGDNDKYGQTKQFYDTLASQSPQSIRDTIWSMIKHDNPDALVLRFLRARKWDVERALIMLVSTMSWRMSEMKVDDDIMRNGEGAAWAAEKNSEDANEKKLAHDFMTQIRKGISYVHGVDKQGRPLCFVNVRLHRQGEQAEEALERYTVYLIETCRMLLQPPVDTATIVFDMTDFSLANMDYAPVKFMIKCFEANYPESLGAVLVHKAPWIFQGIWKVIRGWLDPVVANKVHFTNNAKEMEEFIPMKHIPKSLDGEEDWTYSYVEPTEDENALMRDIATRDQMLAERAKLYREYEEATLEWIRIAEEGGDQTEIKKKRDEIAERLRVDYWKIDPYLRARSYYDRIGVLQPGGRLNWYPEEKKAEQQQSQGNGAAEKVEAVVSAAAAESTTTSAQDLD